MTKKIALVTGGTRGIGAAICIALRDAGYRPVANYGSNRATAEAFTEHTGIAAHSFDVADFEAVRHGIDRIETTLGPVDILVNNAGITRDATLHPMDYAHWEQVLRTNVFSCFNTCRCVIEGMRERGFGRIINIGSINGQTGPYGQVNYAAAKSGIHGFTKALAQENAAQGITVNTIASGYIDTDMVRAVPAEVLAKIIARIPVKRLGQPAEIARAVVFLAAEDAGFITGSALSINGGQHMY